MSEPVSFLIVGGGPAGFAAANAYREHEPEAGLAIVTDESLLPYQRPPLTKEFLRGETELEQLPLADEGWLQQRSVGLISGRAVAIDAHRRSVTLSGRRVLRYRTCLLATGSEPTRLPVPGVDHPRVRVVRTLLDVQLLLARLDATAHAAVVGSGFIGCEIASSLRRRGNRVTMISDEPAPNQARLGAQAAERIAGWLREDGVELRLGREIERIEHSPGACAVVAGPTRVDADLVVLATGAAPRSELAEQLGLTLSEGAIPVDGAMRSECDGVLAAGDVCLAENRAARRPLRVEHWGDALAHGEIAGLTAAGVSAVWDAVPGFWSTVGQRTLKYAAWGDGYDDVTLQPHAGGAFTASYRRAGRLVGVLTHDADADYERAQDAIRADVR
jgi:NADPH-dependent 2,4-dienoyl-CoA reductase/sulfur reductase-like enzyme